MNEIKDYNANAYFSVGWDVMPEWDSNPGPPGKADTLSTWPRKLVL